LQKELSKHGVKSEIRSDITPGVAKAIVFPDPKGTTIEVFSDYRHGGRDTAEQGIMPLKFGHLAYRCNDPVKVTSFYTDVLGFKVSDWMGDRFSFLRCGRDHHTVNFARYDQERLHHMAFEVSDMAEVQRSCDFLAQWNRTGVGSDPPHCRPQYCRLSPQPGRPARRDFRRDGHDAR
jgi:catechol 2,3-dioxygenase-like lactoylglutathione lyase family enzyme